VGQYIVLPITGNVDHTKLKQNNQQQKGPSHVPTKIYHGLISQAENW